MVWLDGLDEHGQALTAPPAEDGTDVTGYVFLGSAEASGEQHYVAEYSEDQQAWIWALEGPTAVLTDPVTKQTVAHHDGGRAVGGPMWTAIQDGSSVQSQLAPGFLAEQYPDRIPPLKIYTSGPSGVGVMGHVEVIQRLQTNGGHPGSPPDPYTQAGEKKSMPYTALYAFWGNPPTPSDPPADEHESSESEGQS